MGRILVPLMPVVLIGAVGGQLMTAGRGVFLAALLAATDLTLRMCWQLPLKRLRVVPGVFASPAFDVKNR